MREDARTTQCGAQNTLKGIVEAPPIDPAEIQAKIDAQAAVVRDLKEEQGLGNSDPEVKAAVAELLRLKALLEE